MVASAGSSAALGDHRREYDPEDIADGEFARSVAFGAAIGIPAMGVLTFLVTREVTPETHTAAIVGLAVWVGMWAGLFIGGIVAVSGHLIRKSRQH